MQRAALRVWILVATLTFSTSVLAKYQELIGHQVWEIAGEMAAQLEVEGLVDMLDHHPLPITKVRVAPENANHVITKLLDQDISYEVLVHDLASKLEEEEKADRVRRDATPKATCNSSTCRAPLDDEYMTFEQIEYYLKEIAETYPSKIELKSIGKSVEGRDLWMAHVKAGGCETKKCGTPNVDCDESGNIRIVNNAKARIAYAAMKHRSVWLEGGLHAREWISPAVCLQLIAKLIENCSVTKVIDVYIVPLANPDGYVYSYKYNRLWRKNRSNNSGSSCKGVDLNRNWDSHFGGAGTSSSFCSEIYTGPYPFSEPEAKALSDEMKLVADDGNLELVIAFHSYGQALLYPWGYTTTGEAPDTPAMMNIGNKFADAVRGKYGQSYRVVNSATGYYPAAGATDDWAKETFGTKLVYTLELRDKGSYGFNLPSSQIRPCSEEIWEGMKFLFVAITPEKDT